MANVVGGWEFVDMPACDLPEKVATGFVEVRTNFREVEGEYVEMEIREKTSDGALIVHADFDPFTLTVYKAEDAEKKYIVFHAPKDSLRFKPAGSFDDYHIALAARK